MSLFSKKRELRSAGWSSAGDRTRQSAPARLRSEFRQSAGSVWQPASAVFSERSGGLSARLVSLAELIADASCTPAGRVLTAVLALTGAWWLL
jgi:hypothetical protein